MNPKQMKRMMKQMGMEMEDVDAEQVIIKTAGGDIVIDEPNVVRVKAMGQKTYQITGEERLEGKEAGSTGIPDEDVNLVAGQAGVSEDEARAALETTGGDLAEAIVLLSKEK
ncbi:MAG: nascent polypeptide-associated complex protein [Candidatus Hydrothermarchaeaceae archaeon]